VDVVNDETTQHEEESDTRRTSKPEQMIKWVCGVPEVFILGQESCRVIENDQQGRNGPAELQGVNHELVSVREVNMWRFFLSVRLEYRTDLSLRRPHAMWSPLPAASSGSHEIPRC
jgi:hypothetical protein